MTSGSTPTSASDVRQKIMEEAFLQLDKIKRSLADGSEELEEPLEAVFCTFKEELTHICKPTLDEYVCGVIEENHVTKTKLDDVISSKNSFADDESLTPSSPRSRTSAKSLHRTESEASNATATSQDSTFNFFGDLQAFEVELLIVDDDPISIKVLSRQLRALGFKCSSAIDGVQAVKMIKSRCGSRANTFRHMPGHNNKAYPEDENTNTKMFDLVLLDVNMPGLNGGEVLRNIIKTPELKDLNVVMMSGDDSVERAESFLSMGAKDYLVKPLKRSVLVQLLNKLRRWKSHAWYEKQNSLAAAGITHLVNGSSSLMLQVSVRMTILPQPARKKPENSNLGDKSKNNNNNNNNNSSGSLRNKSNLRRGSGSSGVKEQEPYMDDVEAMLESDSECDIDADSEESDDEEVRQIVTAIDEDEGANDNNNEVLPNSGLLHRVWSSDFDFTSEEGVLNENNEREAGRGLKVESVYATAASEGMLKILGTSRDELSNDLDILSFVHPDDLASVVGHVQSCYAFLLLEQQKHSKRSHVNVLGMGAPSSMLWRWVGMDGELVPVIGSWSWISMSHVVVDCVSLLPSVQLDREAKLREEVERRLARAVASKKEVRKELNQLKKENKLQRNNSNSNGTDIAMEWIVELDSSIVGSVDNSCVRHLDFSPSYFVGRHIEDSVTLESVENMRHIMQQVGRSGLVSRFHKNGSKRYFDCRSVSWWDTQRSAIVLSEYDVTHLVEAAGNVDELMNH